MKPRTPILQSTARLLLVILLPLSIDVQAESGVLQYVSYSCVASRIFNPDYMYFDSFYSVESLGYANFLLGSLFLITAPLIYFEYRLRSIHPDSSVLPSATVVALATGALYIVLNSVFGSTWPYYWILSDVEIAFTWSFIVFGIFPLLVRETKLLGKHMTKGEPAPVKSRYRPSKYTLLGYILSIIVTMVPFHFVTSNYNGSFNTTIVSYSIFFNQSGYYDIITGYVFENRIWFSTYNYFRGYALEITLLASLGFCIFILRYLRGNATKRSIFLIGLFITFIPYLASLILSNNSFSLPTPFLLLTGFILMKKISVVKADVIIWDEIPERIWYEKPIVMQEEGMVSVKVPLRYMIISRLRVRRFKATPLRPDISFEKVAEKDS
jgi:hypothetical protein